MAISRRSHATCRRRLSMAVAISKEVITNKLHLRQCDNLRPVQVMSAIAVAVDLATILIIITVAVEAV